MKSWNQKSVDEEGHEVKPDWRRHKSQLSTQRKTAAGSAEEGMCHWNLHTLLKLMCTALNYYLTNTVHVHTAETSPYLVISGDITAAF